MTEPENSEADQAEETTEPPHIFLNSEHRRVEERKAAMRDQMGKRGKLPPLGEAPIIVLPDELRRRRNGSSHRPLAASFPKLARIIKAV